jgi:hypothetical protein
MDNLTRLTKSIKSVLVEAELKDVVGKLKPGDFVAITLTSGGTHKFKVTQSDGENVIMTLPDGEYTFNSNDYVGDKLNVYTYNSKTKEKGYDKLENHSVKSVEIGTPGGSSVTVEPREGDYEVDFDIPKNEPDAEPDAEPDKEPEGGYNIDYDMPKEPEDKDIESKDAELRLKEMNDTILSAVDGDNLHFTVNVEADIELKDEANNNLVFEIVELLDEGIEIVLKDANGPISDHLSKVLNRKKLGIDKNNLIKVEDGKTTLDVINLDTERSITIPNIIWVGLNEYEKGREPDSDGEDKDTLSQKELDKLMYDNKELANYWLRSPGAMETLYGASPNGRFKIAQQMKQLALDSAYLAEGSKVTFKILNSKLMGIESRREFDLDPKTPEGYVGTMISETKMIALGQKHQKHWEIELVNKEGENEDGDNEDENASIGDTYKVKYKFCHNTFSCDWKGRGAIKITEIKNKKGAKRKNKNKY